MGKNEMIIAQNIAYSLDCHETQLNNNVLVVGTSGSVKTRSIILDDFATNCKIAEFPRMIASIRLRGISTMLMIQSEAQLEEGYEYDARTIIGNCDTYVYLGGNDVETAESVAKRCDIPVKKILNMPVGTNWIFRRGQSPINGTNFQIEPFLKAKNVYER